jgi:hypothetical protein
MAHRHVHHNLLGEVSSGVVTTQHSIPSPPDHLHVRGQLDRPVFPKLYRSRVRQVKHNARFHPY